tara:strand:- start:17371 stop:18066 length:696 start_codon:yes stop_codon:yes gene_type:complete
MDDSGNPENDDLKNTNNDLQVEDNYQPPLIYSHNSESETKRTLLQVWSSHAATYKWLHDRSAKKLKKQSVNISIPVLILNSLSGLLVYRTENFNNSKSGLLLFELLVGSLNICCVILTGIRDYCKYGEQSELHRQSFHRWSKFKNEIYVEIVAPSIPIDTLLFQMKTRYIDMIASAPTIPNDILSLYEKEVGVDQDEALPDIIDGKSQFQKICSIHSIDIDLDNAKDAPTS